MRYLSVSLLFLIFSALPAFSTTICWDGKELACDSQMTHANQRLRCKAKFFRSDKRHAVLATAGEVASITKIAKYWLTTDKPLAEADLNLPVPTMTTSFALLVIQDDGKAFLYEDDLKSPVEVMAPFAMGTGGEIAVGAMCMGASASEAVAVAEDNDIYTSGTIHKINAPQPESLVEAEKKK